jgi:lipoprotein-releasing system permease protein
MSGERIVNATDEPAELAADARGPAPFSFFEWLIAGRYLRARRREGYISVTAAFSFLGVLLGVAVLIIVMAVMNGFRQELLTKILGVNGHIVVQPVGSELTDYDEVAARIAKVPGVRLATPLVEGQALASSAFNAGGVLVRGMRENDIKNSGLIGKSIKDGTLEGFDTNQGVVIGRRLADQLGLRVGDILTLVSPRGAVTPMGTTPRIKGYPVRGIFEVGMSEYDAVFVFLPLAEAQAYFNKDGSVSAIEVFVGDPDRTDELRGPIAEAAGRQVLLVDWRQRNVTFFSALEVERNVMFLILTLIVLVADLNIISSLIMLVKEKGQAIAILRTMGATRGTVMRIFVIVGGRATSSLSDTERTRIRRTDLGFVYQFHHLLPEFSAIENVMLPQLIAGLDKREARKRADELLKWLGLHERGTHRPTELSGGEQQRVAIARAVANAPRVLFADEPTGNLDIVTAEEVFDSLFKLIKATGLAALVATHNLELAAQMDRRITLRDGLAVEI